MPMLGKLYHISMRWSLLNKSGVTKFDDKHSIVLFEEDGYSGKSSRTNIVRRLSEWHSNNN